MTLFIKNLPYSAGEADLSALLTQEGFAVSRCRILTDRDTGLSRGLAKVDLINPADDDRAICELQGITLFGRELKLQIDEYSSSSFPKRDQRPSRTQAAARAFGESVTRWGNQDTYQHRDLQHQQRSRDCDAVPMEYRAQVQGRCQRQYFKERIMCKGRSDPAILHWIEEWSASAEKESPFQLGQLKAIPIQIDWRLMANSGLDEGIIRPVIAAGAWPIIPGSSIKGLFRKACLELTNVSAEKLKRWCGTTSQSGILRFQGAWPSDPSWKTSLLDLTHPQENWQIGLPNNDHSANSLISLYQPSLIVAYGCRDADIDADEWQEIETTLRKALAMGIGGRTSAGYGSCGIPAGDLLFSCCIEGQFPVAKLLNGRTEFRPTMFRAAIRSMALRLFAGLTSERLAKEAVENLFGTLQSTRNGKPKAGLLAMTFHLLESSLESGTVNDHEFCSFAGSLQWHSARVYEKLEDQRKLLPLLAALHGLVMTFGGFGRSWRRPDHQFFHRNYRKTLIGCHWQWRSTNEPYGWIDVTSQEQLAALLSMSRKIATEWLKQVNCLQSGSLKPKSLPSWREVIDPSRMLVWSRIADSPKDAKAIYWFHERQRATTESPWANSSPTALFRTDLAGRVYNKNHDCKETLVGSIWNRMLPIIDEGHPRNRAARLELHQGNYLETLVIFDHPAIHHNQDFQRFLSYLRSNQSPFKSVDYS
jgi:CRISPR-associated protein Cmr6